MRWFKLWVTKILGPCSPERTNSLLSSTWKFKLFPLLRWRRITEQKESWSWATSIYSRSIGSNRFLTGWGFGQYHGIHLRIVYRESRVVVLPPNLQSICSDYGERWVIWWKIHDRHPLVLFHYFWVDVIVHPLVDYSTHSYIWPRRQTQLFENSIALSVHLDRRVSTASAARHDRYVNSFII